MDRVLIWGSNAGVNLESLRKHPKLADLQLLILELSSMKQESSPLDQYVRWQEATIVTLQVAQ